MTPREVLDEARGNVPNMGIATVYRTVKALVEEGWLSPVEMLGQPQRYERAGKAITTISAAASAAAPSKWTGAPAGSIALCPTGLRWRPMRFSSMGCARSATFLSSAAPLCPRLALR